MCERDGVGRRKKALHISTEDKPTYDSFTTQHMRDERSGWVERGSNILFFSHVLMLLAYRTSCNREEDAESRGS